MADDLFTLEISQSVFKDGDPFGEVSTSSHQMTQTQMVIAQHVTLFATIRVLTVLGVLAAVKKDPEFLARYNAAMTMFGFPPFDAESAAKVPASLVASVG